MPGPKVESVVVTEIFNAFLLIIGFLVYAWLAKRLLGVRYLSAARTVLAAMSGMVSTGLIAYFLGERGASPEAAAVSGIILGVVVTMVVIIGLELLSRPGKKRSSLRRRDLNPVTWGRRQIEITRRMTQVTSIAARHGLGTGLVDENEELVDGPAGTGRKLTAAFEEAGGMFVKLGQLLSTRTDMLPPEMCAELATLQTSVTPASREEIQPVLEAELGGPVEEYFTEFDWDPIGSASIGQVYAARLASGDAVVVKVRRPGIAAIVDRDSEIVTRLAQRAERSSPLAAKYGVAGLAAEFTSDLQDELDYENEVNNAREIARATADYDAIVVPRFYEDLSSARVVVMERLHGTAVGDLTPDLTEAEQRRRLADALFSAEVGAMVSGDRFHTDPHPGNVFVVEDGRLGLIDFGAAGRLDAAERAAVTNILLALRLRDPTLLREAALEVATIDDDADPAQLERAFAQLMAKHLGPGAQPDARVLNEFLVIMLDFGMRPPPSITSLLRALGTLDGTLMALSPGFNLIDAAEELSGTEMQKWLQPESLRDLLEREAIQVAPILQRFPRHVDRIAAQLERGELTTRVSLFSNRRDVQVITRLANRATLAFLGFTLGIVSTRLLAAPDGPEITGDLTLFDLLGYLGLFGGAILVMRVVVEVLRDSD